LGKLRAEGLISYARYSRDFRSPNRPTNTYTLHTDKIQRLIEAGKVVVAKALNAYYDQRAIPKHDRKLPVRMSGMATGQDVPQDVSLSMENLHPDKDGDYEPPYEEFEVEGSTEPSWEDLRQMEEMHKNDTDSNINPCSQSSSKEPEEPELNTELTILTPPPNSAPPPSPPLPAKREGSALAAAESFDEALLLFPRTKVYRDVSRLESDRKRWVSLCNMYGLRRVADIFAWYVKDSDARSLDVLFERFFGYITENLHLRRVDQPAATFAAAGRESEPVDPASETFDEAAEEAGEGRFRQWSRPAK
jgi:hypothetical protein